MVGIVLFGLAIAVVLALLLIMRNATRLFVAVVDQGRLVSIRGRAPKGLVRDITDVVRQRPVSSARLTVFVRGGASAVEGTGDLTDAEKQRLRNVVAIWPVAKIRAAPYRSVG